MSIYVDKCRELARLSWRRIHSSCSSWIETFYGMFSGIPLLAGLGYTIDSYFGIFSVGGAYSCGFSSFFEVLWPRLRGVGEGSGNFFGDSCLTYGAFWEVYLLFIN